MSIVKNVHKLGLNQENLEKLEAGALMHQRYSNIVFKVLKAEVDEVIIQTSQGKHMSKNYADAKTLITRTKELFGQFVARPVHVHPKVYVANPIESIDGKWIVDRMNKLDMRVVNIVNDTGIGKANISAWANGIRPMSQPVKAMFYFYFLAKEAGIVKCSE